MVDRPSEDWQAISAAIQKAWAEEELGINSLGDDEYVIEGDIISPSGISIADLQPASAKLDDLKAGSLKGSKQGH